jgi:hypothetical protein
MKSAYLYLLFFLHKKLLLIVRKCWEKDTKLRLKKIISEVFQLFAMKVEMCECTHGKVSHDSFVNANRSNIVKCSKSGIRYVINLKLLNW